MATGGEKGNDLLVSLVTVHNSLSNIFKSLRSLLYPPYPLVSFPSPPFFFSGFPTCDGDSEIFLNDLPPPSSGLIFQEHFVFLTIISQLFWAPCLQHADAMVLLLV